jgi:hypothetical protein
MTFGRLKHGRQPSSWLVTQHSGAWKKGRQLCAHVEEICQGYIIFALVQS